MINSLPKSLIEAARQVLLNEELSDKQKQKIHEMPNTRYDIKQLHDKVFGEGNETVEIPYSRENDKKITSDNFRNEVKVGGFNSHVQNHNYVFEHLHRNGYEVTDYVGGYARKRQDDPEKRENREEKIGKILNATGASEMTTSIMSKPTYKRYKKEDGTSDWVTDKKGNKVVEKEPQQLSIAQAFYNDPIRAAKKDVKLVVTRSKEGVGGMSTGKGWTSCMNIDEGCNRHYVPKDIEHGTLSAYLVRAGDEKKIDNPVGRINLKLFHDPESGHKIYRPETSVYGAMPKSALHTVHQWAEISYPHKEDQIYTKHDALYNDDGKNTIITGSPDTRKLNNTISSHIRSIVNAHQDRVQEHIDKYGDYPDGDYVVDHVFHHLNSLPEEHKNNIIIHSRLSHQDDVSDKYDDDMDEDDHINKWAHERSVNWNKLSDKDLMHHLNTAEEASKFGHNYDGYRLDDATYTHGKLINEALKRAPQHIKDKTIAHMLDNHTNDWYQTMNAEHGDNIPHLHRHTDNPALIKKIYHTMRDGQFDNVIPHIDEMDEPSSNELAHKIGKHGDDDLIKEFTMSEHYDPDSSHIHYFHKGLAERHDAEEMEHKAISELNLGGGASSHGPLKPVTSKNELLVSYIGLHNEEGYYDPGVNDLYANIAKHTKHQSVFNSLKMRHDTQTPEIQDALKSNKNFNK